MKIKEIRKSKNVTQKQLAEAIGVDKSVISKYEKGIIDPPTNRLSAIANALNVSIDSLLSEKAQIYGSKNDLNPDSVEADKYSYDDHSIVRRIVASANGICELCGKPAPFNNKDGTPHLEGHFIQWLCDGGLPVPENIAVLCPNCHHKIHILNDPLDTKHLIEIAKKHK